MREKYKYSRNFFSKALQITRYRNTNCFYLLSQKNKPSWRKPKSSLQCTWMYLHRTKSSKTRRLNVLFTRCLPQVLPCLTTRPPPTSLNPSQFLVSSPSSPNASVTNSSLEISKTFRGPFFSPFCRAYSPSLHNINIDESEFLFFLDGLNEAFVAAPPFKSPPMSVQS